MFRKLAYADFGNFDAQYYMVVMEIKKQGCSFLDKKVRDKEVTWFIAKNYFAHNQNAVNLATKFPLDEKQMDYANRCHVPYVIFAGENEIAAQNLTVKDMATGTQQTLALDELVSMLKA
jgi:histidyl-tRNA synthetase